MSAWNMGVRPQSTHRLLAMEETVAGQDAVPFCSRLILPWLNELKGADMFAATDGGRERSNRKV